MKEKIKRKRLFVDCEPEVKDAIKALSDRWNCKTNEAVSRAILEALHRPLASAPEPPWAKEIKGKLDSLSAVIDESFL